MCVTTQVPGWKYGGGPCDYVVRGNSRAPGSHSPSSASVHSQLPAHGLVSASRQTTAPHSFVWKLMQDMMGSVSRGADKEQISLIPVETYEPSSSGRAAGRVQEEWTTCCICLEEYERGDVLRTLVRGVKGHAVVFVFDRCSPLLVGLTDNVGVGLL